MTDLTVHDPATHRPTRVEVLSGEGPTRKVRVHSFSGTRVLDVFEHLVWDSTKPDRVGMHPEPDMERLAEAVRQNIWPGAKPTHEEALAGQAAKTRGPSGLERHA
jgi:hypothetical protein